MRGIEMVETGVEVQPIRLNSWRPCVGLAELPPASHVDMNALAVILNRSKKSIQRATRRGDLPRPFKFMGRHVWHSGFIFGDLQAKPAEPLPVSQRPAIKHWGRCA